MVHIYTVEYYSAIENEMNGPRDYHTKWNKSERNIWYHLYVDSKIGSKWTYLWNRCTDTENRLVVARMEGGEGQIGRLGLADATTIQRMGK